MIYAASEILTETFFRYSNDLSQLGIKRVRRAKDKISEYGFMKYKTQNSSVVSEYALFRVGVRTHL